MGSALQPKTMRLKGASFGLFTHSTTRISLQEQSSVSVNYPPPFLPILPLAAAMASLLQGSCSSTRPAIHSLGVSSDGDTSRSISFSSQLNNLCFKYISLFLYFFSFCFLCLVAHKEIQIHSPGPNLPFFLLHFHFSSVFEFYFIFTEAKSWLGF